MSEPIVIEFKHCAVEVWPSKRYLRTVFADGSEAPAAANDDLRSEELAAELGYPDTWQMSLAHELYHTLLSEATGYSFSPTLYGVAHGRYAARATYEAEEALVLSFQRYMQLGQVGPELAVFGDRLPALAAEARALLARLDTSGAG